MGAGVERTLASADGTSIAYETFGDGAPLIAVTGATADRALMRPTAQALGRHFTAINYDRRGRGDSGDTLPYAIEREIEDLAALIDAHGGSAYLYGHSSGAGLVLRAVAAGLPVPAFVLHDPPYSPDDEAARAEARRFATEMRDLLAAGKRAEAIAFFFRGVGMPDEVVAGMPEWPTWPGLLALAHTLAYDSEVMDDLDSGGAVPEQLAAGVTAPGLVLIGGESPPFMADVGRKLAGLLPRGIHQTLEGQDHAAAPEAVAPVVARFLGDQRARPAG